MAQYYKRIGFNEDGTTKEPVQFVGLYVTKWPADATQPTAAFVESDVDVEAMQTLLLKIRAEFTYASTVETAQDVADWLLGELGKNGLVQEIDAVLE